MTSFVRRLALTSLLLAALPVGATVVMALTLEEMTARAQVIVRGVVRRTEVQWDEGHTKIWTWTEVEVRETVKGAPRALVVVKQPGGSIPPMGQRVSGAGQFEPGEDVVVFLEPAVDEKGAFVLLAMAAGKVRLETTAGATVARRDLSGLSFARSGQIGTQGPVVERETLGTAEDFLKRIRAAARRSAR